MYLPLSSSYRVPLQAWYASSPDRLIDRDLLQYCAQLNLALKHWYSRVYHVDSYVRQYDYEHTIHIPTILALDECELWPAAMHRQPG